jgi:hypothetical protein
MSLGLWLERQRYAPGEVVRGFVEAQEQIDGRSVDVALHYAEETSDYRGAHVIPATQQLQAGPVAAGARLDFALTLPPDALPAFRTDKTAVWWEVVASVDKRGFDKHIRLRIDVVPRDLGGAIVPAEGAGVGFLSPRADALPPPGWHPDPWGRTAQRWWDGASWTGRTR